MPKITREEILKLASLSRIEITENEIDSVLKQLQDVLSYAERVKEIAAAASGEALGDLSVEALAKSEAWNINIESNKNINVFAQDIVNKTDCNPILNQAPESQDNFFVVPKIIEGK